jgi:hypothetical protein
MDVARAQGGSLKMKLDDIVTEILCALHERREARLWRRGRAERRKRALRKTGWDELYAHMSKHARGVPSQPASLTAQEAASQADVGEPVRIEEGSIKALGILPLARPPRKGEV